MDILYEDFEGDWLPEGWTRIVSEPLFMWSRTPLQNHSGQYSAWVHYSPMGNSLDEWLVTSSMDFTGLDRVYLEFYEEQQYWNGFGENHSIMISTTSQTDPLAFTLLVEWTPDDHSIMGFDGDPVFLDLSDYINEPQVFLAFRYQGTWADNWFIDDVRVFYPDEFDAACIAALPDQIQLEGGDSLHPQAIVMNRGEEACTFDASMEVLESGSSIYLEYLEVTLEPAEQNTLDFPSLLLDSGHYYTLLATTHLAGDQMPENDQAGSFIDTYTQEHVPLGWLHTNAGSSSSAPADILLNSVMESHPGQLALVRLHTWWPGHDIMYEANVEQCDSLLDWYAIDYVPHFWVDGDTDARFFVDTYESTFLDRRAIRSPQDIRLVWDDGGILTARVENVNPLDPTGDYRLITVITEDLVPYHGGNGIEFHNQAFRRAYPSVFGLPISPEIGSYDFEIACTMDPSWDPDQLRATCFVLDLESRRIWQAATGRLDELRPQVYCDPTVSTVGVTGILALPIVIHPGLTPVMGLEVEIEFDPTVVQLLEILPGNWFTESGESFYFHDYTPDGGLPVGSIHFAAALLNASSTETDTLAICRFQGLNLGATALEFTDLDVRDDENHFLSYYFSLEDSIIVDATETGSETRPPADSRLHPCSPNPFNPNTSLRFDLPEASHVKLEVFDTRGRRVATLIDEPMPAGFHSAIWNGVNEHGRRVASGLYFCRMEAGLFVQAQRMVLLK